LIGIVAGAGASKGFPSGVGEDSLGVGEVRGEGVGVRCGGKPGGFDGGPNELFCRPEPERKAVLVRQRTELPGHGAFAEPAGEPTVEAWTPSTRPSPTASPTPVSSAGSSWPPEL